jgi:predicted phosphodiesterase
VRVAALSDVHGNIAALEVVLAEVERAGVDAIVVGGDVGTGPFSTEVLRRLMGLADRAFFVRGNADRELVDAFDAGIAFDPDEDDPARRSGAWSAARITRAERDFVAGFRDKVTLDVDGLGPTLFCHGTPDSDTRMLTSRTPDADLLRILAGVRERVVVCGHTHVQFDRTIDGVRVLNPGSVGMPYEGRRGAFWALLGPSVELRRTEYDVERAVSEIRASDYVGDDHAEILLAPPDPVEVAEYFETLAAERGERGD